MKITIPLSLGPSWLPKLGAIFCTIGALGELAPDNLPGIAVFKPWTVFFGSAGAALVGWSARQNGVTSEQVGKTPVPNPAGVVAPNPPLPPVTP